MEITTRVRERLVPFVIRHSGFIPMRWLERMRNLANYGLGAGTAVGLPIERSGEAVLLRRLASRWADRREIVVMDVGAHHGDYALAALDAFEGAARIECFEPDPINYEKLAAALGPDVGCHALALSDKPGTARLFTNPAYSPVSSMHPDAMTLAGIAVSDTTEVQVDTLDEVTERLRIDHIDLLKLDVEGHEVAVLKGATRLLEEGKVEVVQFEFGEHNLASRTYLRDFRDLLPGHQLFRLSPRGITPFEYRPSNEVFLLAANYVAAQQTTELP
jgi:FkbM family methyltransferase